MKLFRQIGRGLNYILRREPDGDRPMRETNNVGEPRYYRRRRPLWRSRKPCHDPSFKRRLPIYKP